MTAADTRPVASAALRWPVPEGLNPRGTVVLLPGRGEHPGVYERFGRRLAADAYEVVALDAGPDRSPEAVAAALAETVRAVPAPVVLAGSDTGALLALAVAARGGISVDALLLAGMPPLGGGTATPQPNGWEGELGARTSCPTHRARLAEDAAFVRGALDAPVPEALAEAARTALRTGTRPEGAPLPPVLLVHGESDPVTPVADAHALAAALPGALLVTVADGRHDALNDVTHRSVAAAVVQWLERLRGGPALPPVLTWHHPADAARAAG